MRQIGEIATVALGRAEFSPAAPAKPFEQRYGHCDQHGQYPLNVLGADGVVRWRPDTCPACAKQTKVRALVAQADVGARFLRCTFDNYEIDPDPSKRDKSAAQSAAKTACVGYAQSFRENLAAGACMTLRGNPGTGKNHLAAAIMLDVMRQGFTALRVKASQYLDAYWSKDFGERPSWLSGMVAVDLLVLDEIGRSSDGKGANDAFFRLIDGRYEMMKPTIVITNLSRQELRDVLGAAAYDRLTEGGGRMLNFDWESQRSRV